MKRYLEQILNEYGISINGNKPYDIQVHDPRLYKMLFINQSVGAGEGYMKGMWDCERLDELFFRICRHQVYSKVYSKVKWEFLNVKNSITNQQTRQKAEDVAKVHYNLNNRLFECMLGKSLAYTCGYWHHAKSLDEAQFAKYDLICRKIGLKKGDKVLEIACGMGGLSRYMAENYGCEVVAFDIAKEQAKYAKQYCRDLPVKIYHCDYRDTHIYNPHGQQFDKIVSVGVLEHIGYKNYPLYIDISRRFLKDDGMYLLHSIGGNTSKKFCEPWIDKYIFPHGMLPSLKQVGAALENQFIIEDFQNFGFYYDSTLMAWYENFNAHWPELKKNHDEQFRRMMNYYLLSCAGGFRARAMQLWQFVLTPKGLLEGYQRIG